jgi:hypothetical protein
MRLIKITLIILFSIYSIVLLILEFKYGQDYIRPYFTDLQREILLYGINTTLNTFLLWGCALIFAIFWSIKKPEGKLMFFTISQILIFSYLGFDDRFKFHEIIEQKFNLEDFLILGFIGLCELLFLFWLGEIHKQKRILLLYLAIAGICFFIMQVIDSFFPHEARLRLSFEDLFKVWSSLFLLFFSWKYLLISVNNES